MKIALAQLNYCIGDFGPNTKKIIEAAHKAKAEGEGASAGSEDAGEMLVHGGSFRTCLCLVTRDTSGRAKMSASKGKKLELSPMRPSPVHPLW